MSFMTKIKAKYILKIADQLIENHPLLAHDLKLLVAGAMNSPHPRPQITLGSLSTVLAKVVTTLTEAKIQFALAGGFAVKYWVDIRETLDIDLMLYSSDIETVKKLFPNGRDLPLMYTVRIEGVDIDFLKGDLFAWIDEALNTAVNTTDLGVKIKILKPEYLILFKLVAARERDLDDIKGLLSISGVADKARHLVNKYRPDDLDDIEQLIREVEYGV